MTAHEEKEGPVEVTPADCWDYEAEEEGWVEPTRAWKLQRFKWTLIRDPLLPEPLDFKPITYPRAGESLRDKFKETGLQVIVKMTSIELTPEKPVLPAGDWHVGDSRMRHVADRS